MTADEKANLALIASVVVPLLVAVIQGFAHKFKPRSASERFRNSVVSRVEAGAFDRPETHYLVDPHFIRLNKEGQFEVPGLGFCGISKEILDELKRTDHWIDCIDVSGIDNSLLYLIPLRQCPRP